MLLREIIYLAGIAFIFYVFGLVLSNIINNIFPACDFKRKDSIIIMECAVQLIILYTIYIVCNKKLNVVIEAFYKKITKKTIPGFYTSLILIAFSIGIFKHLENLNERTSYLKKKLLH